VRGVLQVHVVAHSVGHGGCAVCSLCMVRVYTSSRARPCFLWCAPMFPLMGALGPGGSCWAALLRARLPHDVPSWHWSSATMRFAKVDVLLPVNRHGPCQRVDNHRPRGWDGARPRGGADGPSATAVGRSRSRLSHPERGARPLSTSSPVVAWTLDCVTQVPTGPCMVKSSSCILGFTRADLSNPGRAGSGDGASEPASSVGARHLTLPVDRCALLQACTATGSGGTRPAPCRPPPPPPHPVVVEAAVAAPRARH